ncbi:hypothetical protein crov228 [Cafeteria roenbergensis virus]|uniref:Minor capsid protein P11 C-terminal conserved region domain-containing protein n=1 Tax=Cafeteria roenbergensis virus (strain BV-PW1) TaxID=693272 RepID=E3T4Z8_CROVB|nr:hypothetical protein crov228 [Cafeteria roenbergensis virus BV-PW1]ADO67261.1 hypothetical protein crov228 [Cafeteria roenbergensis virus BV-PW1]
MMANSQLTTILLLLAVGVIIYYISQPSEETNRENIESINNDENVVNTSSPNEPSQTELTSVLPEISMLGSTEDQPNNEEATVQIPNVESNLTGMSNESAGASLDTAFMGAIPPNTATDQVDFNRNNVTEYDSSQFLPQEINDEWFDTDFTKAKYNLNDDKMINTDRYIIGVNTVGQSLKNATYDIRGTIPNPKFTVSPWMNSTYEPDNNLKPLC